MGKASRRKHEQRLAKQLQQASPEQLQQTRSRQPPVTARGTTIIFQPPTFIVEAPPKFVGPVYRFFRTAEDAARMVAGQIPISTIDYIRRLENGLATDAEELSYVSYVNHLDVKSGTVPAAIAKQFGFAAEGAGSFGISGIKMVATYPDAFLLCTTTDFEAMRLDGRFGNFCVEIDDPEGFFNAVTEHLTIAAGVVSQFEISNA